MIYIIHTYVSCIYNNQDIIQIDKNESDPRSSCHLSCSSAAGADGKIRGKVLAATCWWLDIWGLVPFWIFCKFYENDGYSTQYTIRDVQFWQNLQNLILRHDPCFFGEHLWGTDWVVGQHQCHLKQAEDEMVSPSWVEICPMGTPTSSHAWCGAHPRRTFSQGCAGILSRPVTTSCRILES